MALTYRYVKSRENIIGGYAVLRFEMFMKDTLSQFPQKTCLLPYLWSFQLFWNRPEFFSNLLILTFAFLLATKSSIHHLFLPTSTPSGSLRIYLDHPLICAIHLIPAW